MNPAKLKRLRAAGWKAVSVKEFLQLSDEEAMLVVVSFDESLRETVVRIPEHALQTMGFETRQRITVKGITPPAYIPETLLFSQAITIGLKVTLNRAGYGILAFS